jgi:hypothetical protein
MTTCFGDNTSSFHNSRTRMRSLHDKTSGDTYIYPPTHPHIHPHTRTLFRVHTQHTRTTTRTHDGSIRRHIVGTTIVSTCVTAELDSYVHLCVSVLRVWVCVGVCVFVGGVVTDMCPYAHMLCMDVMLVSGGCVWATVGGKGQTCSCVLICGESPI